VQKNRRLLPTLLLISHFHEILFIYQTIKLYVAISQYLACLLRSTRLISVAGYPPCVLIVIKTSPPQIAVFARKDSCVIHGCNVTKLTRPVQLLLVNVTSNSSHLMQYDVIKQDNCTHTGGFFQ